MNFMNSLSDNNDVDRDTRKQLDAVADGQRPSTDDGPELRHDESPGPANPAVVTTSPLDSALPSYESWCNASSEEQNGGPSWADPTARDAGRFTVGAELPSPTGAAEGVRYAELEGLRAVGDSIERLITIFARLFDPPPQSAGHDRASLDSYEISSRNNEPFGDPA